MKTKILLNGFGRIGRVLTRILIENGFSGEIYVHNRTYNPNLMEYLLLRDSLYGQLNIPADSKQSKFGNSTVYYIQDAELKRVLRKSTKQFDFLIDTMPHTLLNYKKLINQGIVQKVVISHMFPKSDFTYVFGLNEREYNTRLHNIISLGICDVVALSPVLNFLHRTYGIKSGTILTIHPWLAYQNLLDNTSIGYMETQDYGLYRSAVDNLIPKSTTAIDANLYVLPDLRGKIDGFTIRVPTSSVTIGNLSLVLNRKITKDTVIKELKRFVMANKNICEINDLPLVSKDFQKSKFSFIIDSRFIKLLPENHIQLMLWYDNEWGYAHRIFDFIKLHSKH